MSGAPGRPAVGLDVGSQSVKLLASDGDARRVPALQCEPLQMIAAEGGSRGQGAGAWGGGVRAAGARIDPALRARVGAIGVSGQQHGFVAMDAAGKVLAPAKLWCDTSTQLECEEIMAAVGGAARC